MGVNEAKTAILENRTALGIEFGSTRIKAVLVDDKNQPIASGAYEWENQYVDGIWTYSLEEIWKGLRAATRIWQKMFRKIWDGAYKCRCFWCQCHDAWIYAV